MSTALRSMGELLARHRFFADFPPEFAELVAGCAKNADFRPDQYLAREGDPADTFFLISSGKVALEIAIPGRAAAIIATLGAEEAVGVSWMVAPYRWMFDARAIEPTRAIGIDAKCLRSKCDSDHDLGYEMMKRFVPVLTQRLHATRMQILDVFGQC